jgi:mRNA-degrading endonuclease RelE of RelBE toxin-antitoxin system
VSGWTVELLASARKDLHQLGDGPRQDAIALLDELAEDPMLVESVEMRGKANIWRVRFHGDYRLIYQIAKAQKRVIVLRIRPRSTAYEGMKH